MKRIILISVIALMMFSCKKTDDKALTAEDKAAITIKVLEDKLEKQQMEIAKQTAIDSMQMINELKLPMAIAAAPAPRNKVVYIRESKKREVQAPAPTPVAESPKQAQEPVLAEASAPDESTMPTTTPAEPAKKKGWSNTAKGAVIGAGAGAIGGAVIGKKDRVKGAIIGGVIGAVVGAGTGAILDHKNKKAAELQY